MRSSTPRPRPPRVLRRRDGGTVLVVVSLVMFALMGLGITAFWLTSGNLQVASNTNLRNQAFYVAEAGLERTRAILNNQSTNVNALLQGSNPGNDDVPTSVDATTGAPNGVGALVVDGTIATPETLRNIAFPPTSFARGTGGSGPVSTTMGTYTVWIRNDTAECRIGRYVTDQNGAVLVRSRGVAPDGRTTVVLEVLMGPPTPPGAGGPPSGPPPPELCSSGKNACDDNGSTLQGIVVAP